MKFYDSVKSSVREEAEGSSQQADSTEQAQTTGDVDKEGDSMPFEELKKGAQETQGLDAEEKQEADENETSGSNTETDIEVLSSDGSLEATSQPSHGHNDTSGPQPADNRPEAQPTSAPSTTRDHTQKDGADSGQSTSTTKSKTPNDPVQGEETTDLASSEAVAVLRRIEEQNDELINIMRGIKQGLER